MNHKKRFFFINFYKSIIVFFKYFIVAENDGKDLWFKWNKINVSSRRILLWKYKTIKGSKWWCLEKIVKGLENAGIINVFLERNCYFEKENGVIKTIELIIADYFAQLRINF